MRLGLPRIRPRLDDTDEGEVTVHGYRLERATDREASGLTTYEAFQAATGERVQLSVSPAPEEARLRRRVRRRAKRRAAIRHPNVLPARDAFEEDGQLYLVTELSDAPTLATRLESGALEPRLAVRILSQVSEGIEAAQAAGIADGLLSPAKILVDPPDRAILTDLGSATTLSDLIQPWAHPDAAYFSPELGDGEHLGARTSVYSLGCILFETLVGSPPYEGNWLSLSALRSGQPAPAVSQHRPELGTAFDAVIERALAEDPSARFASPGEMMKAAATALDDAGEDLPAAATLPVAAEAEETALEAEEVARLEAEEAARVEAEEAARLEAEEAARLEAEEAARLEAEEAARLEAEEAARLEAEEAARLEAEEVARLEAEEVARLEAEEAARREAEEAARLEADEVARREAEEVAGREAEAAAAAAREVEERAQREAEAAASRDAEEQAAREAELQEREAEVQAQREAEVQAQREAEVQAQREAEVQAQREAEARAQAEAAESRREVASPEAQESPSAEKRPAATRAVATPAAPARTQRPRSDGGRNRVVLLACAVAAAVALGGYLTGSAEDPATAPAQTAAAGPLSLELPSGWERRAAAGGVPALPLEVALAAGPRGSGEAGLVAARTSGSDLLPPALSRASVGRAEPVRLGSFHAYRHTGRTASKPPRQLRTYAVPTTEGAVVLACHAGAGVPRGFMQACERVASTLRLKGVEAVPLSVLVAQDRRLAEILRRLTERRAEDRQLLSRARTPRGQAKAARVLEVVYLDARRSLERMAVRRDTSGRRRLVGAMDGAGRAYGALARAAERRSRTGFEAARQAVERAEASLARLLARPAA